MEQQIQLAEQAQDDLDKLFGEGTHRRPHEPSASDRQPGENRAEHRARLKRERRERALP
jgi:hypothetical protein